MDTYLRLFETESEFKNEYLNNYKKPWVSVTKKEDGKVTSLVASPYGTEVTFYNVFSIVFSDTKIETGITSITTEGGDVTSIVASGLTFNYDGENSGTHVWTYTDQQEGYEVYATTDTPSPSVGDTCFIVFNSNESIIGQPESLPVSVGDNLYFMKQGLEPVISEVLSVQKEEGRTINKVSYNKKTPLTFLMLNDGTFLVSNDGSGSISYSLNGGDYTEYDYNGISVHSGDTLSFQSMTFNNLQLNFEDAGELRYNVYGYLTSLNAYEEATEQQNFSVKFTGNKSVVDASGLTLCQVVKVYQFQNMFSGCTNLVSAPKLPSMTLETDCYDHMFYGCTNLVQAPELPATTLESQCYEYMFYGCTSLTQAPELPATTVELNCYQYMFYGCTSLTQAPELPATTLAFNCYGYMFQGCTSLTQAPELPATTLADTCYRYMFADCTSLTQAPSSLPAKTLCIQCYGGMFKGCTSLTGGPVIKASILADDCCSSMFSGCISLTRAPKLPATTLAYRCYNYMFSGCTSLTQAPELPATTLSQSCYAYMFQNCTGLTSAPELPATELTVSCYDRMFNGCTSLNYVKALFTTKPSSMWTGDWLKNVASTGTFVKNPEATWDQSITRSATTVPSGWSIE